MEFLGRPAVVCPFKTAKMNSHRNISEFLSFVGKGWPIATLPAVVIHFFLRYFSLIPEPRWNGGFGTMLLLTVVGPFIETFLLILILKLICLFFQNQYLAALLAGGILAALHSLFSVYWGLEVFWTNVVYCFAYLFWRKKSFVMAFMAAFVLHSLHNITALVVIVGSLSSPDLAPKFLP